MLTTKTGVQHRAYFKFLAATHTDGTVGGSVPATLVADARHAGDVRRRSRRASRGSTTATTDANVISTAGDAALSVSEPRPPARNGAFSLPQPLQVAFSKTAWTAPVSNDKVTLTFKQAIGANDALRTGTYSKTLTFTLSTTTP